MRRLRNRAQEVIRKGDMLLLALCVIAALFGIVLIAATTAGEDNRRYIITQSGCLAAGVLIYLALTSFDIDILAGQRTLLFLFNAVFIGILLIWGEEDNTGNLAWLKFPFLPFRIQPAEVCKITYTIILAKTLSVNQTRVSSPKCVFPLTFQMLFIVGLYVVISKDLGVALIFIFVFIALAFVGGVNWGWILGGLGIFAAAAPYLWTNVMRTDQKNRILAIYDPSIDPTGRNQLWQTNQNIKALRNGGLVGMGLGNGTLTKTATLPARHTDSIFSAAGEQIGLVGCVIILLLLMAIIARIVYVGLRSPDYMNRLICIGIASMYLFQVIINVGMCLGLTPIIGLALPFFSYGGSSTLTTFMAMGIVSGIKMRPSREISALYIRPY